jgi:hypothetical protein
MLLEVVISRYFKLLMVQTLTIRIDLLQTLTMYRVLLYYLQKMALVPRIVIIVAVIVTMEQKVTFFPKIT